MAKRNNYVDNVKLYEEMVKYIEAYEFTQSCIPPLPKPEIPEYVGYAILKIAEHFSYKPNFIGYTFRDDMIGDAIENCVLYLYNYDKTRSNPFAYISQIVFFAFLRRIELEKKQTYIKYKSLENSELPHHMQQQDSDGDYNNSSYKFIKKNLSHIISEYEEKNNKKKKIRTEKAAANKLAKFEVK